MAEKRTDKAKTTTSSGGSPHTNSSANADAKGVVNTSGEKKKELSYYEQRDQYLEELKELNEELIEARQAGESNEYINEVLQDIHVTQSDFLQFQKDNPAPDAIEEVDLPLFPTGLAKSVGKFVFKKAMKKLLARRKKALKRRRLKKLRKSARQKRVKERKNRRKNRKKCNKKNKPKNLATTPVLMPQGYPVKQDASFGVSGIFDLHISSIYQGDVTSSGPLGIGRISDNDAIITREANGQLRLLDGEMFPVLFDLPTPNPEHWEEGDNVRPLFIQAGRKRSFITREEGIFHHFHKFPDGVWRISHVEDRNGNRLNHIRDDEGRLDALKTPEGLTVAFDYDERNLRIGVRLIASDGTEKQVLSYAYDDMDRMIRSESFYGDKRAYGYDERGFMTYIRRNDDYEATHDFDDLGRVTRYRTNGRYNDASFEYDTENRITTYYPHAKPDQFEKIYYNEDYSIIRTADPLGNSPFEVENDEGYIAKEVDAEGNETSYTYDPDGNIKSITDGEGRTSFYAWDEDSNLEILIDPDGNSWDYHFDEKGNLEAVEDANRFRTDISNNEQGLPIGVMRHDGLMQRHLYDQHHRLAATVDFNDAKTVFQRDSFGRIIKITDASGAETLFDYIEQLGWDFWEPSSITRPDGVTIRHKTGEKRGTITTHEQDGRKTSYVYDDGGNLLSVTDANGQQFTFHYDTLEQLEKVENQAGLFWTFERDVAYRIVRETDFDGQVFDYAYDRADRLTETIRSGGGRTTYAYDKSGQLTEEAVYAPGSSEGDIVTFEYNSRGLLEKVKNDHAVIELEYDANGQAIAESSNDYRIESDFDCCGQRSQRRVYSLTREEEPEDLLGIADGLRALAEMRGEGAGAEAGPQLQLTDYLYDPLGALKQISIEGHAPLKFTRDFAGRETSRASEAGFSLTQKHDIVGQLTGQKAGRALTGLAPKDQKMAPQQALERHYGWNAFFEPTSVSDSRWGNTAYSYDDRGQVSESRFGDGFAEKFRYDPAQNIAATGGGAGDGSAATNGGNKEGSTAYTQKRSAPGSDEANTSAAKFLNWQSSKGGRVEKARGAKGETISLTYDERGRVSERHVERNGFRPLKWKFVWDGRDRLAHTITPDGHKWAYQYDPFGRRISKTQYILADNDPRPGEPANRQWQEVSQHSFLWDSDVLVWEETSDERTEWYFEPDTFVPLAKRTAPVLDDPSEGAGQGKRNAADGDRQALAPSRVNGSAATNGGAKEARLWYVVTDHLGTPRELLSEDGTIVWAAEYTTWGSVRRLWQADNDTGPLGNFQGHDPDGNPVYSTRVYGTDGNAALKPAESPNEFACPIRFQGQWADEETGLYYNRFRYYDPAAAQYMSPDPIGINGGTRSQGYVNQPNRWIDPLGLSSCSDKLNDIRTATKHFQSEMRKYFPYLDAKGGFPKAGGGLTVPGGHYIEMGQDKNRIRKNIKSFNSEGCWKCMDTAAKRAKAAGIIAGGEGVVMTPVELPHGANIRSLRPDAVLWNRTSM